MPILRRFVLFQCALLAATAAPADVGAPVTVSPGGTEAQLAVAAECPTFSWSIPARSGSEREMEIAIYALEENGALAAQPTLAATLPAGSSSWTPSVDRCLPAGRYAWTLRERGGAAHRTAWAAPRFFAVERPPASDLESAVETVLERWLAEGRIGANTGKPRQRTVPSHTGSPDQGPRLVGGSAVYDPPDCTGPQMFTDVPNADPRCQFIEQIATDGISTGCTVAGTGGPFCPDDPVTRGQLAALLVRAMRGSVSWDPEPDITRAISVPLAAFMDCEAPGGYLDHVNEATGSVPHFLHTGDTHGPVIEFDADLGETDANHTICTRLVVPPDYLAGSDLTFTALADVISPGGNTETLSIGITRTNGSISGCAIFLSSVGITAYTCSLDGSGFAPGMGFNFHITPGTAFGAMDDGVQIHAVELRYTSVQ
jgi:hypothetical protein